MSNYSFKGTFALVMVLENCNNIQQSRSQEQEAGKTQVMDQIMWFLDPANRRAPSPGLWSRKALCNSTASVRAKLQYSDSVLGPVFQNEMVER